MRARSTATRDNIGGARGFTLVELVVVMLLVALMAVFIAPRLQTTKLEELAFLEETLAAIRYAHKVAMTSGCDVRVTVTPTGVSLVFTGNPAICGTAAVANPTDGSPFTTNAPADVSVAGATFVYDSIGDPSVAQDITITGAETSRVIRITDETGFAFVP